MKQTGFDTIGTSKITEASYSKTTNSALPNELQGENGVISFGEVQTHVQRSQDALELMDEVRRQCGIVFPAD